MYLKYHSVRFVCVIFTLSVSFNPLIVSCNNFTLQNEETTEAAVDVDCSNQLNFYHYCSNDNKCLSNIQLPNGNISVTDISDSKTLHFSCLPGYHLIGPPKIICLELDDIFEKPSCIKGCLEPPMVLNGEVLINGDKDGSKLFSDGVVAEYACAGGYRLVPITSQHRVCRQGEWTGSPVTCVFEGCPRFKGILNGRIILEREDSLEKILQKEISQDIIMENSDYVKEGVIMHYKCDTGYNLIGSSYAKCQPTGIWQPHRLPVCKKSKFNGNRTISPSMDYYPPLKTSSTRDYFENAGTSTAVNGVGASCVTPHLGPHVEILAIQPNSGSSTGEVANTVLDGTVIEVTCSFSYRDKHSPCVRQILRCEKGNWKGHFPSCVKAENCFFPAKIPHGELESVTGGVGGGLFDVGGQVTYSCLPGYQLTGEPMLTCQIGGCWEPNMIPMCEPEFYLSTSWPEYWNTNTSLLFSGVTALSVLFVLLSVCLAVIFRHRPTPLHHHHPSAPPPPPTLVPPPPDPDRVALIAFADGIQSGLPSYEEAIRGANSGGRGLLSYRLHHPPWSQRRNPRPDNTIITRQLSSTGESMGSTDTMTVSDVSTNVTLDTVSSHTCSSTSQTASCRAICGSLASFDTSSVLNTEGVPLLEENELEENGANTDLDDNSIPPACDNTSFKLQSDIDSIHS